MDRNDASSLLLSLIKLAGIALESGDASYRPVDGTLHLDETAHGVDLESGNLERMALKQTVADDLNLMPVECFLP